MQELQSRMFKLLGLTEDEAWAKFGYLLDAFRFGVPPHGGMAYGLDRMIMLMAGKAVSGCCCIPEGAERLT